MPWTSSDAPPGSVAVSAAGGTVVEPVLGGPPAESSRRRPATPATTDAAATDPDRIRKLRRDQLGMLSDIPTRGTPGPWSHDSVWIPANAATPATMACGAADTAGSPSELRNPIAANAAIVPAPAMNDRLA